MFRKLIKLEEISFEIEADELFRRVLYVVNCSNLWPKEMDSEKRSITIAGNIHIRKTDEILRETIYGGRLGLFLIWPAALFSKTMFLSRLKIEVRKTARDSSTVCIYGIIGAFINERIYSKAYDEEYEDLKKTLLQSASGLGSMKNIENALREKLAKKVIMIPYSSIAVHGFLFLAAFAIIMHTASLGYMGNWGGYLGMAVMVVGVIVLGYKTIKAMFT